MSKITIIEAVKLIPVSEATLRRNIASGKVSSEKDARGRRVIDVSELQRAYGELESTGEDAQSTGKDNNKAMHEHDRAEIIATKDNQIADLQSQLERAELREDALTAEKSKLLELVSRLQAQNEVLSLPGEVEKKPNWVVRLLVRVELHRSLVRLSITLSCNQTRFSQYKHTGIFLLTPENRHDLLCTRRHHMKTIIFLSILFVQSRCQLSVS